VTEYNAKTGMLMKFPASVAVKTPDDKVTTDTLLFDEVGIYEVPGKNVAVNLFDERESNLESGGLAAMTSNVSAAKELVYSVETVRKPKNLDIYFIITSSRPSFFPLSDLFRRAIGKLYRIIFIFFSPIDKNLTELFLGIFCLGLNIKQLFAHRRIITNKY